MGSCSCLDTTLEKSSFYYRDFEENWDDIKFSECSLSMFNILVDNKINMEFVYVYFDGVWLFNKNILTPKMCSIEEEPKLEFFGKDITEVFDVTNLEHIKEFEYLNNTGTWKQDSIFKGCNFPQM